MSIAHISELFIFPSVELARQHHTTMAVHIKEPKIAIHTGSSTIRLEKTEQWNDEFEQHSVLIFTGQIFLNLLTHNLFCNFKTESSHLYSQI